MVVPGRGKGVGAMPAGWQDSQSCQSRNVLEKSVAFCQLQKETVRFLSQLQGQIVEMYADADNHAFYVRVNLTINTELDVLREPSETSMYCDVLQRLPNVFL